MRFPMLYAVIPFTLGIITQRETFFVGLISIAILAITKLSHRGAILAFLALGYLAALVAEHHPVMPYGTKIEMIASVDDIPQIRGRWQRTTASVVSYKDSTGTWHDAHSKIQLNVDTAHQIAIADQIFFTAKQFPIDSTYRDYYLNRGITGRVYAYNTQPISTDPSLLDRVRLFSNSLSQRIADIETDSQNIALMQALTVGDKRGLSPESRKAYNRTGVAHILAVSGLHVGIIFMLLSYVLRWLKLFKRGYLIYGGVIILILWIYAAVTGFSPSVLRAVIMFTLYQIGTMTLRETNNINTLAAAGMILLLTNPNYLYDMGFQLSFIAMIGIVLLHKPLSGLWRWKVWNLAALTIAAQIAVLPLSCYYFGNLPLMAIFINLALWAVVPTIIVLVFGYLITDIMVLGDCAAYIANLQNQFILRCSSESWIAIEGIEYPLWVLLLMYALMGIGWWGFNSPIARKGYEKLRNITRKVIRVT